MSDSHDDRQVQREPARFRVPCPNCAGGVRTRARLGVRADRTGTGYISETCPDCAGQGWIPLGNGEWKRGSA
ncbi:hypothetical protein ACGFZP_10160 [Kitasatospora sp. NPDC048239]|uniref:hypothetical protein n=1 Tax=unclassified Kitasatospora TaxID=2633591 RepID=UPI003711770A